MNRATHSTLMKLITLSWFSALLLYMLLLFVTSAGSFKVSGLFFLPFYLFIPGYAISLLLPLNLSKQDILMLSLAFSLALYAGTGTILRMTINKYQLWISDLEILATLSAVTFLIKLLDIGRKHRRR